LRAKRRKQDSGASGKCPAEIAGPDDSIPFPKRVTYFDYEGEVAIVIGKRGKNIPAERIGDYVWGRHLVSRLEHSRRRRQRSCGEL
jgi:2-keto-4-pentenoate hydratase/2-oxohepta-3-ene-1,7-dioic acid hydratase in catechol pathway